ncbi:unnamed protein product, partial [Ectocarpus sp. 12 AP-2014]
AVSRTTCRDYIICLVNIDRLINDVPHGNNVVFSEIIVAATGQPPPTFDIHLPHHGHDSSGCSNGNSTTPNNDGNSNGGTTNPGNKSNNNSGNNGNSNNQRSWQIVNEIGDGAGLLRCIARRVFNDHNMLVNSWLGKRCCFDETLIRENRSKGGVS